MTKPKRLPHEAFGTVNPPVHHASTVLYDSYEAFLDADRAPYHGKLYGTFGSPVQLALEKELATIEGGYRSLVCHSGFDAIGVVLMAFTKASDHILVSDNVYGPTRDFCSRVLRKYGVDVDYFSPGSPDAAEALVKPSTKLIYLESPGTGTFEVSDVPRFVAIARKHGLISVLDNTWATPLYFKSFEYGIDVSIHSGSKYIAGHSDVLLGTMTANEERFPELLSFYEATERFAAPDSCYQALKGLQTLPVRLARHEASAGAMASFLEEHPAVSDVLYPALESHPEHDLWKRDFLGASGVFGFTLKSEPSREQLSTFIDPMRSFALGLSWGGFQSLVSVIPKGSPAGRVHPHRYRDKTIVRLSIGLENVDELEEDVADALARLE